MLPESGVILDIGANIGIMTAWLAKEKPNASVISFEPIKENFEVLTKVINSKGYTNVSLNNLALGRQKGILTMIMPIINNAKQQGLSHVFHANEKYDYDGIKYEVAVEKLDSLPEIASSKITGIKMDVENFEYEVLLGAEMILKKYKPILYVELWDNENRKKCFEFVLNLGYEIKVLNKNKLETYSNQNSQNFFFV